MFIRSVILVCTFSALLTRICAPPVDRKKPTVDKESNAEETEDWLQLEYQRYLQEVIRELESDPQFKEKLEKADAEHIKSGKIADELDFLHHDVRSRLDEAKRREIERLRELLRQKVEAGEDMHNFTIEHIDHGNMDGFGKDDLRKLIARTTKDLEDLDLKRREEFKRYELEKEAERRLKLENLTAVERQKAEQEYKAAQKKHKEHEKVKHPGSKDQLAEVWEDVDKLPKESFDLRTFFNLHDLNGNGFLEPDEVESLFQAELDKVYDKNAPEDDLKERQEEMSRMREHVVKEVDKDKDGLISLQEFLNEQQDADFNKDEGWQTLDEEAPVFNDQELKAVEERLRKEMGNAQPPAHISDAQQPPLAHV